MAHHFPDPKETPARGCRPWIITAIALLLAPAGCHPDDPCGPGYDYEKSFHGCVPIPESGGTRGGAEDGGAVDDDDSGAAAEGETRDVPFGAACSTDDDCGGDTAVCVNEPLPLGCTNTDCETGEANAGICPADWMCFPASPDRQSACVQF